MPIPSIEYESCGCIKYSIPCADEPIGFQVNAANTDVRLELELNDGAVATFLGTTNGDGLVIINGIQQFLSFTQYRVIYVFDDTTDERLRFLNDPEGFITAYPCFMLLKNNIIAN